MKNILIFSFLLFAGAAVAQPTIWGAAKIKLEQGDTSFVTKMSLVKDFVLSYATGGGTVTNVTTGNLAPLFTVGITNPTTTPAFAFTLSNAAANTYFGNATGSPAAPSYTAAGALTKADDTNVTLTLGGAPSTSLLTAASLTLGWTGTLAVGRGGIGVGTITGLMQGNGTGAVTGITNSSTVGQVLRVTGASTYAWGGLDLADADAVTGILNGENGGTENGFFKVSGPATSEKTFTFPNSSATVLTDAAAVTVAQGGTGATTLTGTLFGNGTSAVTATALGGDVTVYGSNGTSPLFYTLGITTTSAAIAWARSSGTLNLNLPDADASFRGTVSTGTQTFAGAKTFNALITGSGGILGTSTSTLAAINVNGVEDGIFRSVTTTSTLDENDHTVFIGTLGADITINLPACNSTRDGWIYHFMKKGTDAFGFILDPATSETFFDGATTKTYFGQGITSHCKCENGLGWNIIR